MANPQREDGHLDIANELVDQFCRCRFPGQEWQMLWVILRKTWGWTLRGKNGGYMRDKEGRVLKKKSDSIPLSQFEEMTGIDRRKCFSLLESLKKKNIVEKSITQKGDRKAATYKFQKDYDQWRLSPKRTLSPKKVTKLSPKRSYSKEKAKETLSDEFFTLVNLLSEKMQENDPRAKVPKTETRRLRWANDFRLLVEKDGRPIEEVKKVLIWCQEDSFWKPNILSAATLRAKYPQLKLRMEEVQKRPGLQKVTREEFNKIQEEALKRR